MKVKGELADVYDIANNVYRQGADGHIMRGNVDTDRQKIELDKGVPSEIYTCILKGDPRELARCLGAVSRSDIYDKARREVAQMHPRVLGKLLKTFAFQVNRDGTPEEFLVWRANLAKRLTANMGNQQKGEATATAILGNSKLVEYLKSVVSLYRNNPALHGNADEPLSDLPRKTSGLGSSSKGLNYFVSPNVNRAEAMSRTLNMMAQQLNIMPTGLSQFGPALGVGMNFGHPGMVMPGMVMQHGGSHCEDPVAKEMRNMYGMIVSELNNRGKDLVEEDKKRIEKALSQIEENNKQVCKALNDLRAFYNLVNVDSALTANLPSTVSLSDIEGASRIPNLRSSVANLESCVNRTSRDQVSLLSALVEQVYRPMILLASGVNSPSIRLAY